MADNLAAARAALQAELDQSRQGMAYHEQGVAYFQQRCQELEESLQRLNAIPDLSAIAAGMDQPSAKAQRGRKLATTKKRAATTSKVPVAPKPTKRVKKGKVAKPKAARAQKEPSGLPETPREFFLSVISNQPQSIQELQAAAAAKLPSKPTEKELQKLAWRLKSQLKAMHGTLVSSEGNGIARRYFLAKNQ